VALEFFELQEEEQQETCHSKASQNPHKIKTHSFFSLLQSRIFFLKIAWKKEGRHENGEKRVSE